MTGRSERKKKKLSWLAHFLLSYLLLTASFLAAFFITYKFFFELDGWKWGVVFALLLSVFNQLSDAFLKALPFKYERLRPPQQKRPESLVAFRDQLGLLTARNENVLRYLEHEPFRLNAFEVDSFGLILSVFAAWVIVDQFALFGEGPSVVMLWAIILVGIYVVYGFSARILFGKYIKEKPCLKN